MELSELAAYAEAVYHISEKCRYESGLDLTVLCDPRGGKPIAVLMRQWDTETGALIERCDIRCGRLTMPPGSIPWITAPIRMQGPDWVGLCFEDRTDPETVFRLLDRAVSRCEQAGAAVILDGAPASGSGVYRDTPLPFSAPRQPAQVVPPDRLRQMLRLYEFHGTADDVARNFYRQGKFMEDFEDDLPWRGEFVCYYPTYHDLNTRQLRGYFTWRAAVRSGVYEPVPDAFAYLYLYELLNGIGAGSPEDSLTLLAEFESGYLDAGFGSRAMRLNLHRWMLELAVLKELPAETVRQLEDPKLLEYDEHLSVLKHPQKYDDEAVFAALCAFGDKKFPASPVVTGDRPRGIRLFSEAWRIACAQFRENGRSLFPACFGDRRTRRWYPLENAVWYSPERPADRDCAVSPCRTYRCRDGLWYVLAYAQTDFDRRRFRSFLHEADLRLRRYLKTGRYLREQPDGAWASCYVEAAIADDRRAVQEASRPKIRIDLSNLARIRADARDTRDSLLVEEEAEDAEDVPGRPAGFGPSAGAAPFAAAVRSASDAPAGGTPAFSGSSARAPAASDAPTGFPSAAAPSTGSAAAPGMKNNGAAERPGLPLDGVLLAVLRSLLRGESPAPLLSAAHLMPSLAADEINEALYDEIGDTVVVCEDDVLFPVQDYIEDLNAIIGGTPDA